MNRDVTLYGTLNLTSEDGSSDNITVVSEREIFTQQSFLGNKKDPTPYLYSLTRRSSRTGKVSYFRRGEVAPWVTTQDGVHSAYKAPDLGFLDENRLYNDVLGRANGAVRGDLDLSIDLLQAGKTATMAKNIIQLVDFVKQAKRSIRDFALGTSDAYLTWKYGIMPLAYSIYSTMDESIRLADGLSRVSVRAKVPHNITDVTGSTGAILTQTLTGKEVARMTLIYRNDISNDAQSAAHYTSLNPLSIAWELLPYSFVVDWCYDVGSYLRNMETGFLYRSYFVSGYWTYTYWIDESQEMDHNNMSSFPESWVQGKTSGNGHYSFSRRTVLSGYPIPSRPTFKVDLGSSQLLSAAALLTQLLRR